MSGIQLEKLPTPDPLPRLGPEAIFEELKTALAEARPDLAAALELESEPLVADLQARAYREALVRAAVIDAARGNMLAFATGSNLDHLAALFGVVRLVVTPADPDARPPVAAVLESDERLRARVQAAPEGFSVAGPAGAYKVHALAVGADVVDVSVMSPSPGVVRVYILADTGAPSAALRGRVLAALSHEDVRPLTDLVEVAPATAKPFSVSARLTYYAGPDDEVVRQAAAAAVAEYIAAHRLLGHDITRAGLIHALFQPGVQNVDLISPAADVVTGAGEFADCSGVSITSGGVDV